MEVQSIEKCTMQEVPLGAIETQQWKCCCVSASYRCIPSITYNTGYSIALAQIHQEFMHASVQMEQHTRLFWGFALQSHQIDTAEFIFPMFFFRLFFFFTVFCLVPMLKLGQTLNSGLQSKYMQIKNFRSDNGKLVYKKIIQH